MRIALAQICSGPDIADNLALVRRWTADAASQGARLVVFPEATMRAFGNNLTSIAEPLNGPFASAIGQLAEEFAIAIAVGMFTPADAERVRNTLLVATPPPSGSSEAVTLHSYDKIHLFDAFGFAESDTVAAGEQEVRVDIDGVTVGLSICYDIRFPQLYINHARAGAAISIVPASWGSGPGKLEQWELLARARALDSTSWILACGQADPVAAGVAAKPGAPTGIGHSLVISPTGTVIVAAGAGPELLIADLDLAAVVTTRQRIPVLINARL